MVESVDLSTSQTARESSLNQDQNETLVDLDDEDDNSLDDATMEFMVKRSTVAQALRQSAADNQLETLGFFDGDDTSSESLDQRILGILVKTGAVSTQNGGRMSMVERTDTQNLSSGEQYLSVLIPLSPNKSEWKPDQLRSTDKAESPHRKLSDLGGTTAKSFE